jgi:adenylosuccinate lyase
MENLNTMLPGNSRYQPKQLVPVFGYDNLYKKVAQVEIATLETLGEMKIIPPKDFKKLTREVKQKLLCIKTSEVDIAEREITHHDIRAWVRCAQKILDKDIAQWLHIPLTSYDALDTARILQFREAYEISIKPSLSRVVDIFSNLVKENSGKIQIGRTHGQHALPITVGFWLATILNRIVYSWEQIDRFSGELTGKISGAVGAHNAQLGLGFTLKDGKTFEEKVLKKLNLQPAPISTQILPPEPLGYFLFSCISLSASLGQFGRDARHLMRSEIGEMVESFEKGQVGSSTMAHKRNPINFENLEGMWLRTKNEFGKVLDTLISEHQRDLVGSSIARDYPIILINLQQQLNTLLKENKKGKTFLERLSINEEMCEANFQKNANIILAEPLYIALQMSGYPGDAHELVNHVLVPEAQRGGYSLLEVLDDMAKNDEKLEAAILKIKPEILRLLKNPERYIGDARKKSLEIAKSAQKIAKKLI